MGAEVTEAPPNPGSEQLRLPEILGAVGARLSNALLWSDTGNDVPEEGWDRTQPEVSAQGAPGHSRSGHVLGAKDGPLGLGSTQQLAGAAGHSVRDGSRKEQTLCVSDILYRTCGYRICRALCKTKRWPLAQNYYEPRDGDSMEDFQAWGPV